MSGKRTKSLRRQNNSSHKKIAATVLGGIIAAIPVVSAGDVLFSVYPHATIPLGSNHDIQYGMGVGSSIAFKPIKYFSMNLYGDYMSLALPKVHSITLLDGGAGASYHIPISDRINLNAGISIGSYRATYNTTMSGMNAGMNFGISYRLNPIVSIDMSARAHHYAAGSTALLNGVSAQPGVTLNLTEAFGRYTNINVEQKELKPVFPVLYSWYENNPFGTITIENKEDSKIQDVRVSFFQPQYMGHPNVCGVRDELEKGESLEVNLTAFFNEHMLELTEKTDTQAVISVEYTFLGQKRTCEYPMVVPVYGRNNMSWADDRRASVFVSSKDPAAMWFAKYVASITHDNMRNGVPENMQYAMAIFDTLDQFGLNYVIDPSSAFEDNVGTESIDFLQFPYQTLMYRGGDCDDISILVCSLFEAVGINTAFITIPGHIYMAFDSGLYKREAEEQFGTLDDFIVHGSEVWVPLEITLTDEGFNKAWRVGLREWKVAERNGTAAMYKMRDNWQIYKPVNVPNAATSFTLPDPDIVAKIFSHSVDQWILREIEPRVEGYKAILAKKRNDRIQNSLGTLYARYGLFAQAEEQYKPLRRRGYQPAILNTANIYYAKKDFERAEKWYKEVLKKDKKNVLAYLGVARCCYELEKYDECDMAYLKVRSMDAGLAYQYSYLGAFENKTGRAFNLADRLSHTVWEDDAQNAWKAEYKKLVADNRAEMETLYGEDIVQQILPERDVDVPDFMKFNPAEFALVPETGVKEVAENSENIEGGNDDDDDDVLELEKEEYVGLPRQIEIEGPEALLADAAVKQSVPVHEVSIETRNETLQVADVAAEVQREEKPAVAEVPVHEETFVTLASMTVTVETSVPVEAADEENAINQDDEDDGDDNQLAVFDIDDIEEEFDIEEFLPTEELEAVENAAAVEVETSDEKDAFVGVVPDDENHISVETVSSVEDDSFDDPEAVLADEKDVIAEVVPDGENHISVETVSSVEDDSFDEPDAVSADEDDTSDEIETALAEKNDTSVEIAPLDENIEDASVPNINQVAVELPPVENIPVPRFTKQPSEEWASGDVYTAEAIPGMLSFEEEMDLVENSRAYLYEEDALNIDPDKDYGVTVKESKKTEVGPKVNPFSSFLSKEDAEVVEKITDYVFEEPIDPVVEHTVTVDDAAADLDVKEELTVEESMDVEQYNLNGESDPVDKNFMSRILWILVGILTMGGAVLLAKKTADRTKSKPAGKGAVS
ncbi:tetratricopeptide repeat protein [Treponema sp.]|uniref:tetratricopeptide repeat protein n=1 Tax=Treponema sp. TaxID=166 RepID=UPI00388DD69C